jgi:hypothetical protein
LFGVHFENEFSFASAFSCRLFNSISVLVFYLITLISVWRSIFSSPVCLIGFSWTTSAFGEIKFSVFDLLLVVGPPSGLPSYVFFTYLLLAGGEGWILG